MAASSPWSCECVRTFPVISGVQGAEPLSKARSLWSSTVYLPVTNEVLKWRCSCAASWLHHKQCYKHFHNCLANAYYPTVFYFDEIKPNNAAICLLTVYYAHDLSTSLTNDGSNITTIQARRQRLLRSVRRIPQKEQRWENRISPSRSCWCARWGDTRPLY